MIRQWLWCIVGKAGEVRMKNIWWITDDGTELECAMCKNYVEGSRMKTICLACRHEYLAHTDAGVEGMDYPKADLFNPTDEAMEAVR